MKVTLGNGNWTMKELAQAVGGTLIGSPAASFGTVTHDSRETDENSLFVALRGARVDGNCFVGQLPGVRCYLAERVPEVLGSGESVVVVPDAETALLQFAGKYRERFLSACEIIAVTGSVGKTTAKEMLHAVLTAADPAAVCTEGNHNSVIGLPLSLLGFPEHTRHAVTEMGMSGIGEISRMSRMTRPIAGVITNIGSSHLELLGTRENICRAKCEIADGMSAGGLLFWNGEEPLLRARADMYREKGFRILFFGTSSENTYSVSNVRLENENTVFDLRYKSEILLRDLSIPGLGVHLAWAGMIASAVALELGIGETVLRKGLSRYRTIGMRQNLQRNGALTVIADCYNAAPESMATAAGTLSEIGKREDKPTAALLGDMLELGPDSEKLHFETGKKLGMAGVSLLFLIGEYAEAYREGALAAGVPEERIRVYPKSPESNRAAAKELKTRFSGGGVVLVKGSHAMHLEEAVTVLLEK